MGLDIYNQVVSIIGSLPPELTWVYGFCVIFLIIIIFMVAISPFVLVYNLVVK